MTDLKGGVVKTSVDKDVEPDYETTKFPGNLTRHEKTKLARSRFW